ncbi:MAG: hypothetical protein M1504_01000 [Candidatus Marsarchaeota archaeon]|nr:hypothetical protein [Candidatus Marsarchaeota archaeon]
MAMLNYRMTFVFVAFMLAMFLLINNSYADYNQYYVPGTPWVCANNYNCYTDSPYGVGNVVVSPQVIQPGGTVTVSYNAACAYEGSGGNCQPQGNGDEIALEYCGINGQCTNGLLAGAANGGSLNYCGGGTNNLATDNIQFTATPQQTGPCDVIDNTGGVCASPTYCKVPDGGSAQITFSSSTSPGIYYFCGDEYDESDGITVEQVCNYVVIGSSPPSSYSFPPDTTCQANSGVPNCGYAASGGNPPGPQVTSHHGQIFFTLQPPISGSGPRSPNVYPLGVEYNSSCGVGNNCQQNGYGDALALEYCAYGQDTCAYPWSSEASAGSSTVAMSGCPQTITPGTTSTCDLVDNTGNPCGASDICDVQQMVNVSIGVSNAKDNVATFCAFTGQYNSFGDQISVSERICKSINIATYPQVNAIVTSQPTVVEPGTTSNVLVTVYNMYPSMFGMPGSDNNLNNYGAFTLQNKLYVTGGIGSVSSPPQSCPFVMPTTTKCNDAALTGAIGWPSDSQGCYSQFPINGSSISQDKAGNLYLGETFCASGGTACSIFNFTTWAYGDGQEQNVCIYYSMNQNPSYATLIGNGIITANQFADSYGLTIDAYPHSWDLGNATDLMMKTVYGVHYITPTVNPVEQTGICYPQSAFSQSIPSGDPWPICTIIFEGSSTNGCVFGHSIQTECATPPTLNAPCNLTSLKVDYNNSGGNNTFQEYLNTAYMPDGTYTLCGFELMPNPWLDSNGAYYVPFFSRATLECQGGLCTVYPATQQFVTLPCTDCNIGNGGGSITNPQITIGSFQQIVCNIYNQMNIIFFIFALVLMLLGAILYMGASAVPGEGRGTLRGYGMGFIIVGIVATVIAMVGFFILAEMGSTTVQSVIACAP